MPAVALLLLAVLALGGSSKKRKKKRAGLGAQYSAAHQAKIREQAIEQGVPPELVDEYFAMPAETRFLLGDLNAGAELADNPGRSSKKLLRKLGLA
jgi:hypothetical protein